jgi:hypothetical protein
VTSGGEDDRVCDDQPPAPIVDVEAVRAEDSPVVYEQTGDVDVVPCVDTDLGGPTQESPLDLPPRVVAREAGPPVPVRAEEALGETPVRLASEARAPTDEIVDRGGRLPAEELDAGRVAQPVPLPECVRGMLLPAVLRIHRPERGADTARGEHRVRIVTAALSHAEHLDAALGKLDRRSQAGGAGADDENAGRGAVLLGLSHCPATLLVFLDATSRFH